MSNGWVKLFGSILQSSIWDQALHVRVAWVAMLAACDSAGVVHGTVGGLARVFNLSVEQMEDALARFTAPDPHSRTPDHEGRRIEVVPGGWRLLNYRAYRERGQAKDGSRAPYMREYRHAKPETVTRNTNKSRVTASNTEERGEKRETDNPPNPPSGGEAAAPPVVVAGSNGNGHGHGKLPAKGLGAATERELERLLSDERVCSLVDAWAKDRGRSNREIGVARAATAALAGGYQPDQLALVSRLVALAGRQPERFPDRGSLRWAAQNKPAASYVWRSDALDKLIPEAEAWERS